MLFYDGNSNDLFNLYKAELTETIENAPVTQSVTITKLKVAPVVEPEKEDISEKKEEENTDDGATAMTVSSLALLSGVLMSSLLQ